MDIIVQKYGGTSVGSTERIRRVAERVAAAAVEGKSVVVVVSAMSGETNRLVGLASSVAESPAGREYDVIVSSGEQVSAGLLALTLQEMGSPALSLLAHQIPIITDDTHTSARIKDIDVETIKRRLAEGLIVVVPGFQGVTPSGEITTLGRGGSDTTAVALAAALHAEVCEIYTDVEGVFTTDPGLCADARKLSKISYDEMLEMASLGAKVLQTRSVEFARKYSIPVLVRSSFTDSEGTLVTMEDEDMEKVVVSGITYERDEAKISVVGVPDRPGIAARIFKPLTDAGINVDMIVQNIGTEASTDLTFTVFEGDFDEAMSIMGATALDIKAADVIGDRDISKVSIVGAGMKSHAGIASKTFEVLAEEGINIEMISTSEIKISCVVESKYMELAVRVLHKAFGLADEPHAS
ncbi:MAG: aspartate kinase [Thermodesulfobacteriota bacterium]